MRELEERVASAIESEMGGKSVDMARAAIAAIEANGYRILREEERHPAYTNAILLPRESAIALYAENEAGCGGLVYLNLQTGELLLCDGSDLVLWSGQIGLKSECSCLP
jgi:hypothetical protein